MAEFRVLPHSVAAQDFAAALGAFEKIVGVGWVIADEARLAPYRKAMLPVDIAAHAPSAVVMPNSVEQIQQLLKIANAHRIPFWPISTGRNFGYGSALPATRGQVVLDLKRLDRIVAVDPEMCTALVEPGVTYQQLYDYLAERNLPLWIDPPGPGPLVSLVGNTLERGGGNTPYGDHFEFACGMEVVLADGQVLRTGMGALPGSNSWQCFKFGFGPYLDGMFTQSNFGIVTKLGVWLMPRPAGHRTLLVQYDDEADLAKAVDTIRPLRMGGVIANTGVVGNAAIALTGVGPRSQFYQGQGAIPKEVVLTAARKFGIAAWNMTFSLYGTEEQIAPNLKIVTEAFERTGARVNPDAYNAAQVGVPSLTTLSILDWVGGGGLAWFSPVSPTRGADAVKQQQLAAAIHADHGFDYMPGITLNARDMQHVMAILYDRNVEEQTRRADSCMKTLIRQFARHGYGVYRTGQGYMDEAAKQSGPVAAQVNRAIKRALDPNGILAPGKSGITI